MKKVFLAALLTLLIVSIPSITQPEEGMALKPHDPIYIEGNQDFTPENGVASGSGTEDDPYIIEGWDIDASGYSDGIFVEGLGSDVWLVIRNCRIFGAANHGIRLYAIQHAVVEHCTSSGNEHGITLGDANSCTIAMNECTENRIEGITLWGSANNRISSNRLFRNGLSSSRYGFGCGIYMDYSTGNHADRNLVQDNYRGICLGEAANENEVFGNMIVANREGVVISAALHGNSIFLNNFVDNTIQARDLSSPGENHWDDGGAGNFWGQYTAWDSNVDGIGDVPYTIKGGGIDRYPLMRPWKPSVVAMGIKFTGTDEFATVRNWSEEDVDLTAWQLQSVDLGTKEVAHSFLFPVGCRLPGDGKIRVHSGPAAAGRENNPCGSPEIDLYRGWNDLEDGGYVWDDLEGIVQLINDEGEVLDEYKYHWWMGG